MLAFELTCFVSFLLPLHLPTVVIASEIINSSPGANFWSSLTFLLVRFIWRKTILRFSRLRRERNRKKDVWTFSALRIQIIQFVEECKKCKSTLVVRTKMILTSVFPTTKQSLDWMILVRTISFSFFRR